MSAEFNSQFEMRNAQLFVKVVLYYNDDKLLQCENSRSRVMDSDRALITHYAFRISKTTPLSTLHTKKAFRKRFMSFTIGFLYSE